MAAAGACFLGSTPRPVILWAVPLLCCNAVRTENNDLYLGYFALTHPKYKERTAILPKEVSRVAWKLNMGPRLF